MEPCLCLAIWQFFGSIGVLIVGSMSAVSFFGVQPRFLVGMNPWSFAAAFVNGLDEIQEMEEEVAFLWNDLLEILLLTGPFKPGALLAPGTVMRTTGCKARKLRRSKSYPIFPTHLLVIPIRMPRLNPSFSREVEEINELPVSESFVGCVCVRRTWKEQRKTVCLNGYEAAGVPVVDIIYMRS